MLAPDNQPRDYSAQSDDELVELARTGNATAYGELWRRHSGIGTSIARRYYEIADADDIVSESFARILSTLQRGGGPHSGFRPYLITTIGNVARRWATRSREGASDDLDLVVDPRTIDDPVVASSDRELALEAFRSLPDRWQAVLWYSAVEGLGPTEIGRYLGMTPNATAVLAHRARAGLRTAWIQAHLNDATLPDECRWTAGRLGRRATGSLSDRELERVKAHLGTCLSCRARARELDHLNAKLAVILVPALLGLAIPAFDDETAIAATILPDPVTPVMSGTYAWLVGIAVTVVTAAALITSSTPPESVLADSGNTRPDTVVPVSGPRDLDTLSTLTAPSSSASDKDDATGSSTSPPPPATAPTVPAAPTSPVVTSSLDPEGVARPALAGTALSGAQIVVTDELGGPITTVVADAAGAWSTGELTSLSPAAAAVLIHQVDSLGRISPTTTVAIAPRPYYLSPLPNGASDAASPFELIVVGWPGSTVRVTFSGATSPDHPEFPPADSTYPDTTVVLDWQGLAYVPINSMISGGHQADLRYVDGVRSSAGVRSFNFVVYLPD